MNTTAPLALKLLLLPPLLLPSLPQCLDEFVVGYGLDFNESYTMNKLAPHASDLAAAAAVVAVTAAVPR
jgi:hypothetical protein